MLPIDISGKIPPQAIDIEEAVLGALMLERDAIDKINIKPEYFYKDAHQKIFTSIQKLSSKSEPIDLLTVTESLRRDNSLDEIGGPYCISRLTSIVSSSFNIEYHSLILTEKYVKRELIRISSEIQAKAYDDSQDTFDIFDEAYSQLDAINSEIDSTDELKTWSELLKETRKDIIRRHDLIKEGKIIGIPTPLLKLTKWTCGWQGKQLIIVAGRPGMGKTAWGIGCMKTAAINGYKCAFFSLEMSDLSIANRFVIGESGVDADNFRAGNIQNYEWSQIDNAIGKMYDYNILIDDKPKSINKIKAKVKSLHRKGLCDLVIVDYIQLSWDDSVKGNAIREQEVSAVSRKLKTMAQDLNISVIALCQLNRAVENRPNKKPQLSDLRESGAIEQDADLVIFVHRPDKYGILEDENGNLLNGRCECILEKQREGQVGTIYFKYNQSITSIYDWDDFNDLKSYHVHPDKNIEPNRSFDNEPF